MVSGIFGIIMINLFSDILISNEQNYMVVKEATEAAMWDALDWKGYSEGLGWDGVTSESDPESMHCNTDPGQYRILKEKFVESFTRRFSLNVAHNRNYRIYFNDIDECPPKVSLTVSSEEDFGILQFLKIGYSTDGDDVVNNISAIIESTPTIETRVKPPASEVVDPPSDQIEHFN
jgi:hypothetical protein